MKKILKNQLGPRQFPANEICMKSKLEDIYQALESFEDPNPSISMYTGFEMGYLLFMTFYFLEARDEAIPEKFQLKLERLGILIKQEPRIFLDSGLIGMALGLKIIEENLGVQICEKQFYKDIGKISFDFAFSQLNVNNYDLLHGGGGAIMYLLEIGEVNRLEILIDALGVKAKRVGEGVYWSKIDLNNSGKAIEKVDFGLAHGQASIICLLSSLLKKGINPKGKTHTLLMNNVRFILDNELTTESKYSFPLMILNNRLEERSRLAWCYGDLGLVVGLLFASKVLNDANLKKKAIEIGLKTTMLFKNDETGIADAGLCHGAAGVAHLYNKIFYLTGIVNFKTAANYWMELTKKMGDGGVSVAGYTVWSPDKGINEKGKYDFIEGISGIGLAMISHNSEKQFDWDKLLFFN